ncbi:Gfo/Idh/MocA family protein [Actinacidiphila guanduensis]|uniref:Myo-inositol 2-dehydrogenase / D-chiro-inositol 1-dehydrogenase n=1 Tax=Actinacidiphila guanduensis TaxID=310781 RepID=A0A1G9ZEU0_9ACTN|nr:Gfo/Idh/MocA family oxidoreductase [Actinacidiphila guanduensis]SDN19675.1 myo-inositol 2-dehydrogenase / D-chiro-inositol 1-dehydrogenase [Actinacidiphila guanduensis]
MRIGLIGTGRIGAFHAVTLAALPAVTALVVHDADEASARATAERTGARHAGDLDGLLGAGLDGVVIAAPTTAHAELVLAAHRAGLPAFCEKPVAGTLAETDAVLAATADSPVPLQIGFQRRFDAGYRAVREAVAAGRLGWTHTLRACTSDPAPPHPGYLPGSGGIFRDCSVHDFDAIRWVTGREVTEVYATGANRGEDFFAGAGDVDTGACLLTLDDGTLATCTATRYNGAGYDVRLEVCGSRGTMVAGLTDEVPLVPAEGATWPAGPAHRHFMDRFRAAYRAELTAFTQLVAGERDNPCSGQDARAAQAVADAAARSRAEGRPIRLDSPGPAAA